MRSHTGALVANLTGEIIQAQRGSMPGASGLNHANLFRVDVDTGCKQNGVWVACFDCFGKPDCDSPPLPPAAFRRPRNE